MLSAAKLRVALAMVTMVGAFHLRTAAAAETPKAATQDCTQQMIDFGTAVCDWATGGNWSWGIIWYWENGDGSCSPIEVDCYAT